MLDEEFLKSIIENQKSRIASQEKFIGELQTTIAALNQTVANLQETIAELNRALYGISSESTKTSAVEETPSTGETKAVAVKEHTRTRKPKSKREDLYGNLPIYDRLHEELLKRGILHADETVCQVLRKEGKTPQSTSYMWIYRTGSDGLPTIIMYEYQPGRGGCYPQQFLEGFHGLLQVDGYQGYNKVTDVILICCMAHCRRKFFEALTPERRKALKLLDINSAEAIKEPVIPETDLDKYIPAEIGVAYCNKLFYLERQFKELPPEERKEKRLEQEVPVLENFFHWIETLNPTRGSKLEKAVNYAQNHRDSLCAYLNDDRAELSNNAVERMAKSYAVTRKASLFHASVAGANACAVLYSLVETANANNLNVFQYIYFLMLYMPGLESGSAGIEQLLPWSDFIKEHCSGLIDVEKVTVENKPTLTF